MLGLGGDSHGVFPDPNQVPEGFIVRARQVNGRQLADAMQPGERVGIAAVGPDGVAASFRHVRGADHHSDATSTEPLRPSVEVADERRKGLNGRGIAIGRHRDDVPG